MRRAIDLAQKARFSARPNPKVGCVLVSDNRVVGEGWHRKSGEAHAEINALRVAGESARGSTAFVSLEPCLHDGKTPPCLDALIDAGVARVIAAMQDPNPKVAGGGFDKLKDAGIKVRVGLLETRAKKLNEGFIFRMQHGRPFVRLKLASSLDGATAMLDGESKWITGIESRSDVQKLRASASAVITGINTVLQDDPFLSVRTAELAISDEEKKLNATLLERQPFRVIIDSQLKTPDTANILTSGGQIKIYTLNKSVAVKNFTDNVQVISNGSSNKRVNLEFVLESLASDFSCNEVLVEAGPSLSGAFIEAELADELILYIAPRLLGSDGKPLLNIVGMQSLSEFSGYSVQRLTKIGEDVRLTLKVDH